MKSNVPNEIPVVFHNGTNYELANQFEGQFACLGEKHKNVKKNSVPIEKEVDNDGTKSGVTISYKIKFIDSERFMAR